ncbi:hypothetical protein Tco_0877476 [Tanacetum coccineum]|uniref:Uncharacterized protein n=1 Tax=Tanacetum coccineum TaxID=301880 RepID=A0ABQ5BV97_9ASTR
MTAPKVLPSFHPDNENIKETESDEFIKSSVENLVQNPSESEDEFRKSFHVDYPDFGDIQPLMWWKTSPLMCLIFFPPPHHLLWNFDFIPSHNDLGSDLDVSSPSGDRNKIYDLGICIEVESTRFLATLSLVIDTLLPFSSKNEDKVFNHGVLALKEKSPPSSSHRGFKASKLFHHKSPMIASDYEASRARGFVLRSLDLQHPQLHYGNLISNLID